MLKYEIIESKFNPSTNTSTVQINTKLGVFSGTAKLNPKDKRFLSMFIGGEVAEARAVIKMTKAELRLEKIKLKELTSLLDLLQQDKNFNKKDFYAIKLFRRINRQKRRVEGIEKMIQLYESTLQDRVKKRQERVDVGNMI